MPQISSSKQAASSEAAAMHRPSSHPRSPLPDLGPDLWQHVFSKLGRHPKDIVPLGAVCKDWHSILDDVTWKELCLQHAPGLVEALGYNVGSETPPGGWRGLYKFMVYCPGLNYPSFHPVCGCDTLSSLYSWRGGCGHLDARSSGFCTGDKASDELSLADSVGRMTSFSRRFADIAKPSIFHFCRTAIRHCLLAGAL